MGRDGRLRLRAGEARAALEALGAIKSQDHGDPFLLQWETIARYRAFGWRAARGSFFTLALRAAEHLTGTLTEMGDSGLSADWERFWLECAWLDPGDVIGACWFPAWYLISKGTRALDIRMGSDPSPAGRREREARESVHPLAAAPTALLMLAKNTSLPRPLLSAIGAVTAYTASLARRWR